MHLQVPLDAYPAALFAIAYGILVSKQLLALPAIRVDQSPRLLVGSYTARLDLVLIGHHGKCLSMHWDMLLTCPLCTATCATVLHVLLTLDISQRRPATVCLMGEWSVPTRWFNYFDWYRMSRDGGSHTASTITRDLEVAGCSCGSELIHAVCSSHACVIVLDNVEIE